MKSCAKIMLLFLAVAVLSVSVTDANAVLRRRSSGSCNYYYGQNYDPSYVTYYAPVQKIVTSTIAPLMVNVPIQSQGLYDYSTGAAYSYGAQGQTGYYSAGHGTGQQQGLADQLRAVIREEINLAAGQPQQYAPQQTPPTARQALQQATAQAPEGGVAIDDVTPPELQAAVLAAFTGKANCVNCHGAVTTLSGDFRLVVLGQEGKLQLVKLSSDKRWKSYALSSVGAMPPAAANDASKAMEVEHLTALLKWAAQK